MSILLFCLYESMIITREAETIDGERVGRRHYIVRNHMADICGYPENVLHHDVEKLLSSSLYRLATAEEQDRYMQTERAKGTIQEGHDA
jgi:hypothetical protein